MLLNTPFHSLTWGDLFMLFFLYLLTFYRCVGTEHLQNLFRAELWHVRTTKSAASEITKFSVLNINTPFPCLVINLSSTNLVEQCRELLLV